MKTKGKAMRTLAMANVLTLALTRKAKLTPARLTMDIVNAKHRKTVNDGFNPVHKYICTLTVHIHVLFSIEYMLLIVLMMCHMFSILIMYYVC